MDFFDYISSVDPAMVAAIIQGYGYQITNVQTSQDLADCARQLVNAEGEGALKKLVAAHPDREILLSYFGDQSYSNADGAAGLIAASASCGEPTKKSPIDNNSNLMLVFLMGATLLITAAIITK